MSSSDSSLARFANDSVARAESGTLQRCRHKKAPTRTAQLTSDSTTIANLADDTGGDNAKSMLGTSTAGRLALRGFPAQWKNRPPARDRSATSPLTTAAPSRP